LPRNTTTIGLNVSASSYAQEAVGDNWLWSTNGRVVTSEARSKCSSTAIKGAMSITAQTDKIAHGVKYVCVVLARDGWES